MLSFTGFLVSFMMRTDINIAMVAMVKMPPPDVPVNTTSTSQEPQYCYAPPRDTNGSTPTPEVRREGLRLRLHAGPVLGPVSSHSNETI